MSLPSWIHCNSCGHEYSSKIKFYLLNCQHVLCICCLQKTGDGKRCPIDQKSVERIALQKLPSHMKSYFQPAEEALKVALNAMNFQQQQQASLVKFARSYEEKHKRGSHQVAKLRVAIDVKKAELMKVRDRRIKMQQKLKEMHEKNKKKSPSMMHRSSGVVKTPSSVASSTSPSSAFTSSPRVVKPVFSFSPASHTSSVRTVTTAGFFDQKGPFMTKVQEYKEIYSQKGSQKSHSSRKPFFS